MKSVNDIADMIMYDFAKQNLKSNNIIDYKRIIHVLMKDLNPKEKELFDAAIQTLVADGRITVEDRYGYCLVLSPLGEESIYPVDKENTIKKIQTTVMSWFESQNSRTGAILVFQKFNQLFASFNPKEKALLKDGIEALMASGYVESNTMGSTPVLTLTEAGYDALYV